MILDGFTSSRLPIDTTTPLDLVLAVVMMMMMKQKRRRSRLKVINDENCN